MKESVDKEAFVMPSRTLSYFAGRLAFGDNAVVFVEHFAAFNLFARDKVRVARIRDLHAAQHLTDNHFDVLVVDLHALQTVDVLHFVDDVARKLLNAEQTQNVVRIGRTLHDFFTALHDLTVVHEDLLVLADQELVFNTVVVGDDEALLTLGFLAERNRTGFFGRACRRPWGFWLQRVRPLAADRP